MSIQELFHAETDAFMARFDFDGGLSYNEVSLALWKKFKEAFNDLASNVDGLEPEVKWEPMDIISSFATLGLSAPLNKAAMPELVKKIGVPGHYYHYHCTGRKLVILTTLTSKIFGSKCFRYD